MRTSTVRFATFVGTVAFAALLPACHPSSSESAAGDEGSVVPTGASAPAASASAAGFPIPSASVALVLNPEGAPPYTGPTGSVEGTVTVTGPPAPDVPVSTVRCPAALDTYGKLFREGKPDAPGGPRTLADAVVVVTGYVGFTMPEKNDAVKVTIGTNCAYPTRTIAITYGQRLEIANRTPQMFAPFIDQASTVAVMVAPPLEAGDPVKLYPTMAGYFTLSDRMEPFVKEDLYVFRHPLHTVTDTAGHYRIDGLPVGKVKVGVHHPGVDADAESPLDVVAGTVGKVDLVLTYKPKVLARAADAGAKDKRLLVH
jgi:hypothetical protein